MKKYSKLTFVFPGFEQVDAEHLLGRTQHCANKTGQIWGFDVARKNEIFTTSHTAADMVAKGEGWQTSNRYIQFDWGNVIDSYETKNNPLKLVTNFAKYLGFFIDLSVIRYAKASMRYWAFAVFPLFLVILFAIMSFFLASFMVSFGIELNVITQAFLITVFTILLTLISCRFLGNPLYLILSLNDWAFARDMVNRSNPAIEAKYAEFAQVIIDETQASDCDEIIITAQSFGAAWAAGALASVLERKPEIFDGKNVTILALGSSLLKIALVSKAKFFRDWIKTIITNPNIFWHEFQTKDDVISFYKADPFTALKMPQPLGGLRIDRVNFKHGMDIKRYRKMKKSFYRTHRQYGLYLDKPAHFDYFLRLFAPFSAREFAQDEQIIHKINTDLTLN